MLSSKGLSSLLCLCCLSTLLHAQSAHVTVGTASGAAGANVNLSLGLTQGATPITALQFDLTPASGLSFVSVSGTQGSANAGKTVSGSVVSGSVRVLVYGGTTAIPSSFAAVTLSIAGGSSGTLAVGITGILASDASANQVSCSGSSGSVAVSGGGGGDTTPPTLSNVKSSNITSTGATISWTTSEASDAQVEYGTTTLYGNSTGVVPTLVINHSVALTGLKTGTTYHYRVTSKDAAGNPAISGDLTFTTNSTDQLPAPTNVIVR